MYFMYFYVCQLEELESYLVLNSSENKVYVVVW